MKTFNAVQRRKGFPRDPSLNPLHLGLRLKEAREKAGFSVYEAATALKCEGLMCRPQQYMDYEAGIRVPTLGRLQILAAFFGVPMDQLTVGAVYELEETIRNMNRTVSKHRAIGEEEEESNE